MNERDADLCEVLCMQAYDAHMNLIMSEVEETITLVEFAAGDMESHQIKVSSSPHSSSAALR